MNIWSFSGASARAISLFRMAQAAKEKLDKPNVIIGQSSGAILAPILAVSFDDPTILLEAIKQAENLDIEDMFPYKGNKPFTKGDKIAPNAVFRALTHNHLGWQDIAPMFKLIFKQKHFELLKKSNIECLAFGVDGLNWSPILYCFNDAKDINDLINMIESTARIVPFVQPMNYKGKNHVDGGFISFSPAMWLFDKYDIKKLVCFYSHEITHKKISDNQKWYKNILTITAQAMTGTTYWLGYKDAIIEELYCKLNNIDYLRLEAPNGYTDEIYETDDTQLIALGKASFQNGTKKIDEHLKKNDIA